MNAKIQTLYTAEFDYIATKPDMINIRDIAHALAKEQRYANHKEFNCSVAEHSVLVADMCPDYLKLAALLHDGHEAYMRDLPAPVKPLCPGYVSVCASLQEVINLKFLGRHLTDSESATIHKFDVKSREGETVGLCSDITRQQAENLFLAYFDMHKGDKS